MAKIYKYQKITDQYTTHVLMEPDNNLNQERITELCVIDGWTYVSVPDSVTLPEQPKIITETLSDVTLDQTLMDTIIAASPVIQSIKGRVVDKIREKYSVNDEIKLLRIGPSTEAETYNSHVEACRAWGKVEKEKLLGSPMKENVESWLSSKEAFSARISEKTCLVTKTS